MKDLINKIHLGDSLDLLKKVPDNSVDLIVTDPPYVLDTTPNGKTSVKIQTKKLINSTDENIDFISNGFDVEKHFKEWNRVCKKFNAFIFCSNSQLSEIMKSGESRGFIVTCLVWHKSNSAPFANGVWRSDIEFCVHIRQRGATFKGNAKQKKKVTTMPMEISKYGHPTEKPLELIKKYIEIGSNENDVVLDPFVGSGTTVNACIQLNRQYIAYEINEKYYSIACEREQRAKGNFGLFKV